MVAQVVRITECMRDWKAELRSNREKEARQARLDDMTKLGTQLATIVEQISDAASVNPSTITQVT